MKTLIGNFHNGSFGGGEFYTYQVAKAVSSFSEVIFCQEPNKNIWKANPSLKVSYRLWNGMEQVDNYINLSHFQSLICNTAKRNILGVFFPNQEHTVADYTDIVAICSYSADYCDKFWGRTALVCQPYSKDLKPGKKVKNTIVSVGNFFMEPDGHSKNQHLLIDAFSKMGPEWKLTLIGGVVSEPYLKRLQEAAKGLNVEILPNAPEEVKEAVLASAEVYWHANGYGRQNPYQTEHFGIAPEEALKSGCLTYVHASGGAKDFCTSWDTLPQLTRMTKHRYANPESQSFQTPENMEAFWKELLLGN